MNEIEQQWTAFGYVFKPDYRVVGVFWHGYVETPPKFVGPIINWFCL